MLGRVVFDRCKECDCGEERLIVNKTRYLCEIKNRERLDKNKLPKKRETLKQVKSQLRRSTAKKDKQNRLYREVCIEIDSERGLVCESCGTTQSLSHSHLIPRSRRQDLIAEKKNIKIQCTERVDGSRGCHQRYESGDIGDFIDKDEILLLVKELDKQFYYLKFVK